MPDLKQYWQEVRAIENSLPVFVWLMSLENPKRGQVGGSLAEVGAPTAARLLHLKSHRMATESEIEAHQAGQEQAKRLAFQERLRKQGVALIPLSENHRK